MTVLQENKEEIEENIDLDNNIPNIILKQAVIKLKKDQNYKTRTDVLNAMINASTMSIDSNFIFAYGSLRKDQYNYKHLSGIFGKDSLIYISTVKITHACLHDLGEYPVAITSNYYSKVTGDILYCSDRVFEVIKDMETAASYRKSSVSLFLKTDTNSMKSLFIPYYVANQQLSTMVTCNTHKYPEVKGGDWIRHLMSVVAED